MVEGVHATVSGILGQYGLSGNVLEDALGLPNAVASALDEGGAAAAAAGASAEEQAKADLASNTSKAALGIVFGALAASNPNPNPNTLTLTRTRTRTLTLGADRALWRRRPRCGGRPMQGSG